MTEQDELLHYGTERKSGRYPWGSGENPQQRNKSFLARVDELKKQGLSESKIAEGMGMTTTQLRARKSIAGTELRAENAALALRLKDSGMSNVAIGKQMGINESSVRSLLDPASQQRNDILNATADMLRGQIAEKRYLDIGAGVEQSTAVSDQKLKTAVALLEDEGYQTYRIKVEQLGTGNETTIKVLGAPDTSYSEVVREPSLIKTIDSFSDDGGRTFLGLQPPRSIDQKRVEVRYAEDGGTDRDGLIEVRRGVDDVSIGDSRYAQVRMAVDGTHYLKGMAVYSDDLPPGVDVRFNTNKSDTGNKLAAMKPMKDDPDNPFGSAIRRQLLDVDADGNVTVRSAMNLVNEEGDWSRWSKNLSSQMLSKQSPTLARQQLGLTFDTKKAEYDEIMALTNPAVRKKLLESFADGADSSAVHLKAAGLPRTASHVILPIPAMKDTEIYAPNYRNGEKVVLIRHPHGGTFEIPELTVNNRQPSAKSVMGGAVDAVGISPKVAARLSGADFDGDTVLVIPNNSRSVRTSAPLSGLKDFDPQTSYPAYDGMKRMTPRSTQVEMGKVSNLITDMTIRGASTSEIARAVRHSMVVIDAEKHNLDYRRSAKDNNIRELKLKYQPTDGRGDGGASTLISRASSEKRVENRKARSAAEGGAIDAATGKRMYTPTGESYVNKKGETVIKTTKSTKLGETDDAHTLSSGTPIERVYADHSNRLKALANSARKSDLETKPTPYSPSAKALYKPQVATLNAKLNVALKNAPLERQAQLIANATVSAKRQSNPDMDSATIKKLKGQALDAARQRTGAKKQRIVFTPDEWEAVQAGAISHSKLMKILSNSDLDQVKELATPRTNSVMNAPTMARANSMLAAGYTQSEIADALGVPTSTLNAGLMREES